MAEKEGNPQPQSGAGSEEREGFRRLPESKNKSETGQDTWSLAPLLHWDVDREPPPSEDIRSND